jgi:kynurenine formamidase
MSAHIATHVDAPGHFIQEAFDSGRGVESLSLETLNGPALLLEVPPEDNITGMAGIFQLIPYPSTALSAPTAAAAQACQAA